MESSKRTWVHNAEFTETADSEAILAEMPGEADYASSGKSKAASAWYDELDALPVLTRQQEIHLFKKMNFLKWRGNGPDAQPGDLDAARAIRERLVRANLRLVHAILRKNKSKSVARENLVSKGQFLLWKAVENFDYARGYRFNTFATFLIERGVRKQSKQSKQSKQRLAAPHQFDTHPDRRSAEPKASEFAGTDLELLLRRLSPREKEVVSLRHGLDTRESLTLTEIGEKLKLSKTRVRQYEQQAYKKMRKFAE